MKLVLFGKSLTKIEIRNVDILLHYNASPSLFKILSSSETYSPWTLGVSLGTETEIQQVL